MHDPARVWAFYVHQPANLGELVRLGAEGRGRVECGVRVILIFQVLQLFGLSLLHLAFSVFLSFWRDQFLQFILAVLRPQFSSPSNYFCLECSENERG